MSVLEADRSADRMPVSVFSGFLGSGKTTLLNRLLRHPGMGDSAVVINEFGAVPLDHDLVESVDGEVAVLASGCVCCTLRDDLAGTLRDLLARRDAGTIPPFRRILVETTGLADPAPILQLLLNNPLLGRFVRLDAVVTTVDALHVERQLAAHREAVKQVALADRLLLTKLDLGGDEPALRRRLSALAPRAEIVAALHGDVAPDLLFGVGPAPDRLPDGPEAAAEEEGVHADSVASLAIAVAEPLDWPAFSDWLARLRRWHGEHLLRVKGVLNIAGEDAPVAIHGVHHVFHPPVRLAAWPEGRRGSRIVFITQGLPAAEIRESFAEHVRPAPVPA